jgi:hypothetical protein
LIISLFQLCISYSQVSDEEKLEIANKWVKENHIPLNTLHKVPQNEILYNCDSTLFRKELRGDTIYFWTSSGEWMQDLTDKYGKKNLPELINSNSLASVAILKILLAMVGLQLFTFLHMFFLLKRIHYLKEWITIPSQKNSLILYTICGLKIWAN